MRYLLLALVVIISFSRCTDSANPLFTIQMEGNLTIDPGLNTFDTYYFPIKMVPTNINAYRGSATNDEIRAILPQRAKITALFDDIDWSVVQQVIVYAIADGERREIFYQDRITINRQSEILLFSSIQDVKSMMIEDHVDLEVAFRFREVTSRRWDARLEMSLIADGQR